MPGVMIMFPIAVAIATIFVAFFLWSVKNGDFDDLETRGKRILFDRSEEADTTIHSAKNKDPSDNTVSTNETTGGSENSIQDDKNEQYAGQETS